MFWKGLPRLNFRVSARTELRDKMNMIGSEIRFAFIQCRFLSNALLNILLLFCFTSSLPRRRVLFSRASFFNDVIRMSVTPRPIEHWETFLYFTEKMHMDCDNNFCHRLM